MKHLMLSTAIAAVAFIASPALAQEDSGVKLGLGGMYKGYVSYVDMDEDLADIHAMDILHETEVHFKGETTLDNGLTVGAKVEAEADGGDSFAIDESYVFFEGSWGKVNFGDEDGAAFLLQVSAPAVDENVDGVRQLINPFRYSVATANTTVTGFNTAGGMDYDNDLGGNDDKITYISPEFNGFQAGVSWIPDQGTSGGDLNGNALDDQASDIGNVWQGAIRYEGEFNTVGINLGAGYTHGDTEEEVGTDDDFQEWNVGADLDIGDFGLGLLYTEKNNADETNDKNETWVAGADYTTGAWRLGLSYLNNDSDESGVDVESDRWVAGAKYTYGPGMTFRTSLQHVEHDIEGASDVEGTALLVGTQIDF